MFFDRNKDIEAKFSGNLPHMHQDETMQYVTFRLGDSLPLSECADIYQRLESFKKIHPLPWDGQTKNLYWKQMGPIQQRLLDNGYGACWLKHPECRKILIGAISYRDNIDYEVYCYVIMPNHVHMLIRPLGKHKIEDILHSIKLFSARRINALVGRRGIFWMKESFDRMVRNYDHLKHCHNYIINNPKFLPDGTFTVYVRDGIW